MEHQLRDNEVFAKAARGDVNAFKRVVEHHQAFVFSVAYRMVNDKMNAQDIAQEVFIRLWKNMDKYRDGMKFTTWLYKIITNLCLDFLKSSTQKNLRRHDDLGEIIHIPDNAACDDELLRDEFHLMIRNAAATLTSKQKIVFILRDVEGLSVAEVSEVTGMSPGNIKSNLYYARLHISEKVRDFYEIKKQEK